MVSIIGPVKTRCQGEEAVDDEPAPNATSGPRERTWRLLREAARELLRSGKPLTVPAVAEVAGVSRATAYRYFPTNDAVVLHASMSLADDPLADAEWAPPTATSSGELTDRAADLVRATAAWAFEHENELRTMLRLSLAPERANLRPRRGPTNRRRWIDALLKDLPPEVSPSARRRLAAALTPLFGSDAIVWTTDVAELSRDEAVEVLAWMAQALIAATLADDRPSV
jgi:AcrR family transcriptional regulator